MPVTLRAYKFEAYEFLMLENANLKLPRPETTKCETEHKLPSRGGPVEKSREENSLSRWELGVCEPDSREVAGRRSDP